MKINANQIRPGNVIQHQGKQFVVLKINILQPGKGGAFIQVDMRDLKTGLKTNERWRTQESVERMHVEERACSFLFSEGEIYTFMDVETYEQSTLNRELLADQADFLQDGMEVVIDFIDGQAVAARLPAMVTMTVVEADAVVKGQTASSSYKPAILENGRKILVPPHIEAGTRIVVNTVDGSYAERAKD